MKCTSAKHAYMIKNIHYYLITLCMTAILNCWSVAYCEEFVNNSLTPWYYDKWFVLGVAVVAAAACVCVLYYISPYVSSSNPPEITPEQPSPVIWRGVNQLPISNNSEHYPLSQDDDVGTLEYLPSALAEHPVSLILPETTQQTAVGSTGWSNGIFTYFWDILTTIPNYITGFLTP